MKRENAPQFITEDDLRQHFGLREGGEIQLIPGTRFTPAAQQMINDKKITVRWRDAKGQVFVEKQRNTVNPSAENAGTETRFEKVHPLTSTNVRPKNTCQLCHSDVAEKPALLTHLDNHLLVLKTHPRILLRGKLDSCICYCVLLQCEMQAPIKNQTSQDTQLLCGFMADIRSYLGQLLQAEVTGNVLPLPSLGPFDAATLHSWSHNPLKHLGHDHMLPDVIYGPLIAKLNILRAQIRELELGAIQAFTDNTLHLASADIAREDIVAGLNRLSSAVYVVMILSWQTQNSQAARSGSVLERLVNETA